MRPITSTMLQQNNNNNYPCLNVSGSTREMLQKCSRASLPFPSRLELGLGDLPLIRGLRAWALCSKNRRKAGGLLGGTQAPTAPPVSRGGLTFCPRPADVCLSGEWSCMGYGLPLGLEAGQAGIGALVTVATLKKSEGSGKTQTQCLFLQTEKGSCLYSTTKPGSGLVGGWLRGKTGGGGSRDTPAGRREHGPAPQAQTGANRVRLRAGRRWRKSCNTAGWERTGVSRESQPSSREDPGGEISLEERQEEQDKGGVDSKQFPSLQQDIGRAKQEKDGALRSLKCCHNASPKTCAQCGRCEHRGGESPRDVPNKPNSEVEGMRKERKKSKEEGDTVSAVPNPDLESNHFHPESHSGCDAEIRKAESSKEMKTEAFQSKDDCSRKQEDTITKAMKIHVNKDSSHGHGEQVMDNITLTDLDSLKSNEEIVNGFGSWTDHVEAQQELDKDKDKVNVEEKGGTINQTPAELSTAVSNCYVSSGSIYPSSISITVSPEPSAPVEGSTCKADHKTCVLRIQENSKDHLEGFQQGLADPGTTNEEFEQLELNCAADENNTVIENRKPMFLFKNVEKSTQPEKRDASSSPLRHRHSSIFNTDRRIVTKKGCNCSTTELNKAEWREGSKEREEESQDETEQRVNPDQTGEASEVCKRECVSSELDGSSRKGADNTFALRHSWELQKFADGCRGRTEEVSDTCGQTSIIHVETNGETNTSVTNAACTDPPTSPALSLGNPAPSLPPLGSMATGLPCLEAEKQEEEGVRETAGDIQGGQEGKRSPVRELVEQGEEERGSTVATEEEKKEEEDDEFGVFMQAEGELAWSKGSSMSASGPCGSRESVALGNHAITGELTHWTPGWTDSSFHQSDETWTAFSQDSSAEHRDVTGQWWPTSAVVEREDALLTSQNLAAVFTEAFPSFPGSSPRNHCDLDAVPTLTQLLRDKAKQDQGLLDSFHDLNKMICLRYQRPNGVSRDLLLRSLQLEPPHTEIRAALRTTNRRLSPGLPSANQHSQNAVAKRRLSYDYNRNIME